MLYFHLNARYSWFLKRAGMVEIVPIIHLRRGWEVESLDDRDIAAALVKLPVALSSLNNIYLYVYFLKIKRADYA